MTANLLRCTKSRTFLSQWFRRPDKSTCNRHLTQRLHVLYTSPLTDACRIIGVSNLKSDVLKPCRCKQCLVFGLLQCPRDASRPQLSLAHHIGRKGTLFTQNHHIGDGEPSTGLEHPVGFG